MSWSLIKINLYIHERKYLYKTSQGKIITKIIVLFISSTKNQSSDSYWINLGKFLQNGHIIFC